MTFYQVRNMLNNGTHLNDIHLRVTFYARVSTDKIEQLSSLDNQVSYFKNYILDNLNWEYVPGYIDEGISGSSVRGRKEFMRMIADAKEDKFDLILTKEVSRFSRSLSDSIKYTQDLMNYNVGVLFQTNGINTYDANSEFILNMMGSVAQEEVKRLSMRIKWGAKNAILRGRVLGSNLLGYQKDKTILKIDHEKAKLIKLIFTLYATGNYGLTKLGLILSEKGYLNSRGNIYDKESLKRVITNPKYKGYYQGHTTEVIDYRTKKRIKVPIHERIIFESSNIPAIVSSELWEKANQILLKRTNKNNYKKNKYPLSGLLICGEHEEKYIRTTGSKRSRMPKWVCGKYMKYNLKACKSCIISELDLNHLFKMIYKKFNLNEETIIQDMLNYYHNIDYEVNEISKIEKKLKTLLNLKLEELITDQEYLQKKEELDRVLQNLKSIKKKTISKNFIKDIIMDQQCLFVSKIVNKIVVFKINNQRDQVKLDVYLKENISPSTFRFNTLDKLAKLQNKYLINLYPCSN